MERDAGERTNNLCKRDAGGIHAAIDARTVATQLETADGAEDRRRGTICCQSLSVVPSTGAVTMKYDAGIEQTRHKSCDDVLTKP